MSMLGLRFLGVGNSHAFSLGSSSAVLEVGKEPCLLIDCGPDTVAAYLDVYNHLPQAIFITHPHLDHIGGLENLFYRLATGETSQSPPRLFIPVPLIAVLQRRLADYPNLLAEGGCNFWDVFQLVPVSERFWHRSLTFSVFPVRHHEYLAAFGLALEGRFLYTGDTRPIPETLSRYASRGERIFHDCSTVRNPSHTSMQEVRQEYQQEQWRRMVFYHYESEKAAQLLESQGFRIAGRGDYFDLDCPVTDEPEIGSRPEIRSLSGGMVS